MVYVESWLHICFHLLCMLLRILPNMQLLKWKSPVFNIHGSPPPSTSRWLTRFSQVPYLAFTSSSTTLVAVDGTLKFHKGMGTVRHLVAKVYGHSYSGWILQLVWFKSVRQATTLNQRLQAGSLVLKLFKHTAQLTLFPATQQHSIK